MLNIRDMRIDPACLGQKKLLVDVVPVHEYRDNKRTDTVVAYRYIVALPELRLEKIGVKIDGKMQVIDVFGNVIPGLYASGEVAGGFHGRTYLSATAFISAVVLGWVAADTVVKA